MVDLQLWAFQHPELSRPAVHERTDAGAVVRLGHDESQHSGRGAHATKSAVLPTLQPEGDDDGINMAEHCKRSMVTHNS